MPPIAAQETPAAVEPSTEPNSDIARLNGQLTPVAPKTYILLDKQGNPQMVLDINLEEFLKTWQGKQVAATPDATGSWTLSQADYKGKIVGNHVSLTAKFTISIDETGEVQVPLGLNGAVLAKLPTPPADQGNRFLRFDTALGGYLVTLQGSKGDSRQVELDLMIPLERDGTRVKLRMLAPRAIKSELRLESATAIQLAAKEGQFVLKTRDLGSGVVELQATGIGGETVLSWIDRPISIDVPEATLTSSANVLVKINGREVQTSTKLTVEGYGRSFREFDVELPRGVEYQESGVAPPIQSIKQLPSKRNGGTRLKVLLNSEQSEPVSINLETKESLSNRDGGSNWTLRGIAVSGAVLQKGEVALVVDEDWQVRFQTSDGVRFIHPSEANLSWLIAPPEPEQLTLALRYVGYPWQVPMMVVPRQQQIFATPKYKLHITPDDALLRMEVAYRIEGGRSLPVFFTPRFSLRGWDHVETSVVGIEDFQAFEGPDVFSDPLSSDGDMQQIYGFDSAYATSREPTVTLQLRRAWQPDEGDSFAFRLPNPVLDTVVLNSSELVVSSDTSLQITPDESDLEGLLPMPITDGQDSAGRDGPQFRYRGNYALLEFAARRQPRSQRLLLDCESEVNIESNTISVTQNFMLDIRHQPAAAVRLVTPRDAQKLQVELLPADEPTEDSVGIVLEVPEVEITGPERPERLVPLTHPHLGKVRLRVTYQLPKPESIEDVVALSLAVMPGAEFGKHRLELTSNLGQELVPDNGSPWRIESSTTSSGGLSKDLFTTTQATPMLALATAGRTTNGGVVDIDRIWVQSWLTPGVSQLRTVFRFRSTTNRLRVELPDDAPDGDQVEVKLDSKTMLDEVEGDEAIELEIPLDDGQTYHTLELRYRNPASMNWTTLVDVDRPRLVGNAEGAELVWQVITPIEYQPVWQAPALVQDFLSVWSGSDWRVRSDRTTAMLEGWVGASNSLKPSIAEHALVYQAWQDSTLELQLVRRELLVLAVASLMILAGIALWYLPSLRRVPVMLLALVAVACLGLAFPDQVATFLRFGFFGGVCGLLAWLLILMVPLRTPPSTSLVLTPSGQSERSGSHQPSLVLSTPGSQVSTNAPTVAVEITESNG